MNTVLSPMPKLQFLSDNGIPLNGGYLYYSVAGQPGVPKATYSDAAGTPNTNPVILDSAGRASIWLDGAYYVELWTGNKTVAGSTLVWTQDYIPYGVSPGTVFLDSSVSPTYQLTGYEITVVKTDAAATPIVLSASGKLVNEGTSYSLYNEREAVHFVLHGTTWIST